MKCNYMNWQNRKDIAIENAQWAIDRKDEWATGYWKRQADFCQSQMDKMLNASVEKWLDMHWNETQD